MTQVILGGDRTGGRGGGKLTCGLTAAYSWNGRKGVEEARR